MKMRLFVPKNAVCSGCRHWMRDDGQPTGRCYSRKAKTDGGVELYGLARGAEESACAGWNEEG